MLGSSEISSHCFFDLRFSSRNFCTLVTSSKFLKISFMILYEIDGFFLPKPENVWTNIDKDGPFVGTVFSSLKKKVVFTKPRRGWVLRLLPISPRWFINVSTIHFKNFKWIPALSSIFVRSKICAANRSVGSNRSWECFSIEVRSMFTVFRCCCGECNSIEGGQNKTSKNVGMITR